MKKYILTIVAFALTFISYSQNIQITNKVCEGKIFSMKSKTDWHKWTIDNISIKQNGDTYNVSYKVYTVMESFYNEIPNDTTAYSYIGTFKKLTNKDGSGYTLFSDVNSLSSHSVIVTEHKFNCDKYPERSYHYFSVMIHHQVADRGYSVAVRLTPEEFAAVQTEQ